MEKEIEDSILIKIASIFSVEEEGEKSNWKVNLKKKKKEGKINL